MNWNARRWCKSSERCTATVRCGGQRWPTTSNISCDASSLPSLQWLLALSVPALHWSSLWRFQSSTAFTWFKSGPFMHGTARLILLEKCSCSTASLAWFPALSSSRIPALRSILAGLVSSVSACLPSYTSSILLMIACTNSSSSSRHTSKTGASRRKSR